MEWWDGLVQTGLPMMFFVLIVYTVLKGFIVSAPDATRKLEKKLTAPKPPRDPNKPVHGVALIKKYVELKRDQDKS